MDKINRVAILIDGGFFIQRFKYINKRPPIKSDVEKLVKEMIAKVQASTGADQKDVLYRTYFYDCMPYEKDFPSPDGKKMYDAKGTKVYKYKTRLLWSLKKVEQLALRLGELSFDGWKLDARNPKAKPRPDFKQKGVDMKMGLDMAWMASSRIVDKIVLVAGDSDFVSPIKFVRREGIIVYLYPMKNKVKHFLYEHSDIIIS